MRWTISGHWASVLCALVVFISISSVAPSLILAWGDNHAGALGVGDSRGWVTTPLRSLSLPHDVRVTAVDGTYGGVSISASDGQYYSSGHVLLKPAGDLLRSVGGPALSSSNGWSVFPELRRDLEAPVQGLTWKRLASRNCTTFGLTEQGELWWVSVERSTFFGEELKCGVNGTWLAPNTTWTRFPTASMPSGHELFEDVQCNSQTNVCALLSSLGSIFMMGSYVPMAGFYVDENNYIPFPTAVPETLVEPATAMSLGGQVVAYLTANGSVWSWGPAIDSGVFIPMQIAALGDFGNASFVGCTDKLGYALGWNASVGSYDLLRWGLYSSYVEVWRLQAPFGIDYEVQSFVATSWSVHILTTNGSIFTLEGDNGETPLHPPLGGDVFHSQEMIEPNWGDSLPSDYVVRRIFGSSSMPAVFVDAEPRTTPPSGSPLPTVHKRPASSNSMAMAWGEEVAALGVGVAKQLDNNNMLVGPLEMRFFYDQSRSIASWAPGRAHTAITTTDGQLWTFGNAQAAHFMTAGAYSNVDWNMAARVLLPFRVITAVPLDRSTVVLSQDGNVYMFGEYLVVDKRWNVFAMQDEQSKGYTSREKRGLPLDYKRPAALQWSLSDTYQEVIFGYDSLHGSQLAITEIRPQMDTAWLKDGANWWRLSSDSPFDTPLVYNATQRYGEALLVGFTERQMFGVFSYDASPFGGPEDWVELRVLDDRVTRWCASVYSDCSLANNTVVNDPDILNPTSVTQIVSGSTYMDEFVLFVTDSGDLWMIGNYTLVFPDQKSPSVVVKFEALDLSMVASPIVRVAVQHYTMLFITENGQLWATEGDWAWDMGLTRLFSDYFWIDAPSLPRTTLDVGSTHYAVASRTMNTIDPVDYDSNNPYHAIAWGDNTGGVLGFGRGSMTPGGGLLTNQVVLEPTPIPPGHVLETLDARNITLLGLGTAYNGSEFGVWGNSRLTVGFQAPWQAYSVVDAANWGYGDALRHAVPHGIVSVTNGLTVYFSNIVNSISEPDSSRRSVLEASSFNTSEDYVTSSNNHLLNSKRSVSDPRVFSPKVHTYALRWARFTPNAIITTTCASRLDFAGATLTCSALGPSDPFLGLSASTSLMATSCLLQDQNGTICIMGAGPEFRECSTGLYGPPEDCMHSLLLGDRMALTVTGWNLIPTDTLGSALNGRRVPKFQLGYQHAIGLATDNLIVGFGSNELGQLSHSYQPELVGYPQIINVSSLSDIQWWKVVAGGYSSYAVSLPNTIYSWGDNHWGQLGSPSFTAHWSDLPSLVATPTVPIEIAIRDFACSAYNCFLAYEHGEVYTWGSAQFGLLARTVASGGLFSPSPAIITSLPFLRPGFLIDHFITSPTANSIIARGANNPIPPFTPLPSGSCTGNPPTAEFVCVGGIWTFFGTFVIGNPEGGPTILTISGPTIIEGNFTVTSGGTLIFAPTGLGATSEPLLKVSGCFQSENPLEVQLAEEDWEREKKKLDGKTLYLLETGPCSSSVAAPVILVKSPKDCRKLTSTTQSQDMGNGRTGYTVLFNVKNSCNTWWIVVLSVLGALGIISLVAVAVWLRWRKSKLGALPSG
jgi:hypothetical protein